MNITLNVVGYDVLRDQLPVQLEAGAGPDLAFVTNLGGLQPYYVDLTPYVDAAAWEAPTAPSCRGTARAIRTGSTASTPNHRHRPYVNLTMFEEAGVELPPPVRRGRTGPRPPVR